MASDDWSTFPERGEAEGVRTFPESSEGECSHGPPLSAPQPLAPTLVVSQAPPSPGPSFVYVMAFTAAHLSETRNTIASLRRAEADVGEATWPTPAILLYSDLPDAACRQLRERWAAEVLPLAIPAVDVRNDVASHGTREFSHIVVGKFAALADAMKRHPDAHIVWLDTDLYFFRDPRRELLRFAASHPTSPFNCQASRHTNVCTGFFHLPPGPRARAAQRMLLAFAYRRLASHIASGAAGYKGDEACINEELVARNYGHARLPAELFPNGDHYFTRRVARPETAVLVHNNFIRGLKNKIKRFKAHGFWLPEADDEACVADAAEVGPAEVGEQRLGESELVTAAGSAEPAAADDEPPEGMNQG